MDLALAFGMPVGVLSRLMTERELARWIAYMRKRKLPQVRIESYLAQIAYYVVAVMGGNANVALSDFLLDFESKEPARKRRSKTAADPGDDGPSDEDIDALKDELGFNPIARNTNGS